MIERRGDEIAMALEIRCQPCLHHPDVALVREHDALRRAGRARRVEEHRGLARARGDRLAGAGIPKAIKARLLVVRAIVAEMHRWNVRWNVGTALRVAEHELGTGIPQNEMDG